MLQDGAAIPDAPSAAGTKLLRNGYPAKSAAAAAADASPAPRPLHDVCLALRNRIDAFLAEDAETPILRDVQAQLRLSIAVTEEALQRYRPDQISLSYNGGKDCLVLLVIILACLARQCPPSSETHPAGRKAAVPDPVSFPDKLQAVYIVSPHPFAEVDDFVVSSAAEYRLDISRYTLPMKQGLETFLTDRPGMRAIFVGTRRTDPHGGALKHFDPTDPGWPAFMRIHPVIDWHYAEIWAFIRRLGIPYCTLYDQGYTSLGGTQDTHPNPQLKKGDENGARFRPAYELMADDEERLGRDGERR